MKSIEKEIPCKLADFYTKPAHLNTVGGTIAETATELEIRPTFIIGHREKGALLSHATALHLSARSSWTTEYDQKIMLQPGYETMIRGERVLIVFYKEMGYREREMLIHIVRSCGGTIVGKTMVTEKNIVMSKI